MQETSDRDAEREAQLLEEARSRGEGPHGMPVKFSVTRKPCTNTWGFRGTEREIGIMIGAGVVLLGVLIGIIIRRGVVPRG